MYSAASKRHRRILSVCLPAAIAAFCLVSMRNPSPPALRTSAHIKVYNRDNPWSSIASITPKVTEVRRALYDELRALPAGAGATDQVREALNRVFLPPSKVTEQPHSMYYAWEWDPEQQRFVWVCTGLSEFEISFGAHGAVIVEVEDESHVL